MWANSIKKSNVVSPIKSHQNFNNAMSYLNVEDFDVVCFIDSKDNEKRNMAK